VTVHPPLMWQELERGMGPRGDIRACQRGLWAAGPDLGYLSTNARNGNYGEETSSDNALFREAMGMGGDRDVIGGTLFPVLWEFIDANGRASFCDQPAANPTPAPRPKLLPLERGMNNKGVEACQRALWRALPESGNARNGNYGEETARDVREFRDRYKVNAGDDGDSIGGELWNVLTRWMDDRARELVANWTPQESAPPASSNAAGRVVDVALGEVGYQEQGGNDNRYGAWYGMNHQPWCAMFVTWCAEQVGTQAFVQGSRYAYCPYVVNDARAGRFGLSIVQPNKVQRGDIVLFDWGGDGVADHIGLVTAGPGNGNSFTTVEGNTSGSSNGSQSNGDGVYQRTRYVSDVECFARFS
jgi:peptidoglycan hydrolase-like protein with peptidoglycan-binding domain